MGTAPITIIAMPGKNAPKRHQTAVFRADASSAGLTVRANETAPISERISVRWVTSYGPLSVEVARGCARLLARPKTRWPHETERNLSALFDAAEAGHAILLLRRLAVREADRGEVE